MINLLQVIDEHLGTAPPSALSDGAPSQRSRLIVRIPARLIRRDLGTALEVWIVDDARGPRVVLVVSEPDGVGHELVVDAGGKVVP